MHFYRSSFGVFGILCLTGWFFLSEPFAADQGESASAACAFKVVVPDSIAGHSLARAGSGWQGVISCLYQPESETLLFWHTAAISERELLSHIRILSSRSVTKTSISAHTEPDQAAPASNLALLPACLLGTGILFILGFMVLSLLRRSLKSHQGVVSQI